MAFLLVTRDWKVRLVFSWWENQIVRIKGEGVPYQVYHVRCGILVIWVRVTGSTHYERRMHLKISSGSTDSTYESLDPVSKVVNWSQHPLLDPIHEGRSKFTQVYVSFGKVYVQRAIHSVPSLAAWNLSHNIGNCLVPR